MDVQILNYLRLVRRHWLLIGLVVLLGGAVAGGVTALTKPSYTASTQLFVSIQGSGSVAELNQGSLFTQERVQTYVETVTTPLVLDPVIEDLDLNETVDSLASRITAEAETKTVLMTVSVEDGSARRAATISNAIGKSLAKVVAELEKPDREKASPVEISTVKSATVPLSPSSPNLPLNIGVGLFVGLLLGVLAALARELLDTRVRDEEALRRVTELPVLGRMAYDSVAEKQPLWTQLDAQGSRAESIRQLRANLQFSHAGGGLQSILFTSSLPEEGKTTMSINVAMSLADSGQRVLLIDGDLRRPRIAKYLGVEGSVGLTTYLVGQASVNDVLQPYGDSELYVLASGRVPPNPSELLGSDVMEKLIADACREFDTVIIDGPPLLPVADSAVISQLVGGVVLVVGAHKAKAHEVEKALNSLSMVDAKVLGVVLNRLPMKGADAYRYNYYQSEVSSDDANIANSGQAREQRPSSVRTRSIEPNNGIPTARGGEDETWRSASTVPDAEASGSGQAVGRRRHSSPAHDLVSDGSSGGGLVNSSSRPIIRSPEIAGFDGAVFNTNEEEAARTRRGENVARHVRR